MHGFSVTGEAEFDPKKHVEKVLGTIADGDVTVACWEPGQISPNHCHPHATEIYICFTGGRPMPTPERTVAVTPGSFIVHPAGEVHEYANGPQRTLLFRVRYGADMRAHHQAWRGHAGWQQSPEDAEYYRRSAPMERSRRGLREARSPTGQSLHQFRSSPRPAYAQGFGGLRKIWIPA